MALKKSTYSSVDELPDLLQEKKTDYKSVDELPDLKKKSSGGVSADIGGTVGSSKAQSGVSTDPLQNQKRVFSGLNKAPISTSTPFSTGEVQKSEEKKPDNSVFNPANSVKHDIRELDTQELKEYNKRANAVETKPQTELIGQIKEERKDPVQQKKLALDYIADDMKESATSPIVDQHGLDVPQYFNSRKKEITSEIESINNETAGYRNALRLGEIKQPSPEAEAKIKRKDELTQKLSELNKYSNIYNQERAISDVNPSLSPDEKVIQIGRNLRKVNELDKVKKEESDIYNGVPVDKPEVKSIRDFNDELAGINALRSKTIEDYKSGAIPEDEAKAQLQFLKEKDNTLDEKYPAAAIESIRGLLSEDIANSRKQANENAPKNSGGNLSYYWNNIVSAAPSKEEIKSSIDRARKSGAKISLDQENELMKDPDKFALTSMLGHLYHGSIVAADQAMNNWMGNDKSEREKDFKDASINQMEQPSELPVINEDGKVRMAANEKAGQKNPIGWGTLNNVAEVGGTIANYILLNKGMGALAELALGGVAGAEVAGYGKGLKEITKLTEAQKGVASNVLSSTFLNYPHNKEYAKTLTDNEGEQDAYAVARSLITGVAFFGLNPNKIISGVSASTEKNIAEKFLEQYKAGKGTLNPDGMKKWFADVVVNTAKDLGHNVTTIKADQLAGIALDRLTNKEAFQNRDVTNEMVGNLPSDVLALVPFSAIAGYKKSSTDIGIRNAVKLAISDPVKFESDMMDKVATGVIKKEDAEQKIGYIKELVKTSGGADMKSERVQALPENDQFKYAVNLAKESNLKSKSENITDKVQLDEHKRDINELTDERKAILNGMHDEYQSNVALFDRAYEKGTHNQTLDAGTKSEGVKYLSEQALTAPNSFKNQTGRDTELTTDLIALNPKEAIREEIKGWKDKIKPDATQAETESIQKHIDLLEAGLEKKSPKKAEDTKLSQPIEGVDEQGIPIGDNVPTPTETQQSGKDGVGQLKITNKTKDILDEVSDEKIGEKKYQDFSIDFEDGARAYGKIEDGVADISGINAPKEDGKVVRGSKTYERVLSKLKESGVKTVNIKLQSNDSEAAIKKLVDNGLLTNPRNIMGSSGNEHPVTFDIGSKVNFIEKKNTGTEIEPELGDGRKPVTLSGSTEAERQVAIEQRKKETKQTPMTESRDKLLERIQKYNKLSRSEKRQAYIEANKIKLAVDNFNNTHEQKHSLSTNRDGSLELRNNPTEKRSSGKPIKNTLKGNENSIVDNGKPLMERDDNTKKVFQDLLDADVLPVSRRVNGERMSEAEHDATIQDIMDGIPSQRAENYLNSLEKQIKEDNFDFGNPDKNVRTTLNDALQISVEAGEPMTIDKVEHWLKNESELTKEDEILFDNLDNLITHYEQLHESESGTPAKVQQPAGKGQESNSRKANENEQPKSESSTVSKTEPVKNEEAQVTQDTNTPTVESKEQPLVTDPTSKGEAGKTEAEVRKAIEEAASSKKSENGKKVAMEEEAAKHGKVGEKVLAEINKEGDGNKVGVSHESLTDLAKRLGLKEPETGEWHSPQWYADRGRELLKGGADPKEVNNTNNELHDRISIARANLENLVKEADKIAREKGVDSDEYKAAHKEVNDYANNVVKKLGTKAGQAMTALQGERDIDTDSFTAVRKAAVDAMDGKPLSKEQEAKIKDLIAKNEELKKRADEAERLLIEATDKAMKEGDTGNKKTTTKEKAKKTADIIRKLKTTRPDTFSSGNVVWDGAVEVVAKAVELGGTVVDAIAKGIEHIKASDWYKKLSDDKKEKVEKDFSEAFANEKETNKDKLDELHKMFVDKNPKDTKFSIDEAKAIWDYAKEQYLDRGISFRDMIAKVADDTGLTWKQTSTALTSKKTERISDEMWKKSSERLKNQHATKNWIEAQNKSLPMKWLRAASAAFRGVAVFGHGGIFIGTHAGMTLFNPSQWKFVIPAFIRGWKFAYGNTGKYERRIEQLRNDRNYVKAQRAGLKNNPDNINTEEFQKSQKIFEKVGGNAGIKGFNAIKVLRQDIFNAEYDKLSEVEKNDPTSLEQIAKLANNATGATNLKMPEWVNEVTFAGGMEATRWGKLTRNPMRATAIAVKALVTPEKATVAERVFAKVWARRVGEQLGTMAGMLIANAALQNTINPNNPTNLTDPDKPDFMKFKFGDLTIDPTSGMRGTGMFIYGLGKIPFMDKKELRGDSPTKYAGKSIAGYTRGKLAPLYSTMADFFDKQDFNKNPMPFSNDKPAAGHHKLTWTEYAWQKAPLPVAHAAGEMYKAALDHNGGTLTNKHIIDGIIAGVLSGGTGFRIGEYNAEESNHSPYTKEDKADPTFKYYLDKGMELPNTSLSSEIVTDKKSMTKKKVSEYPKEVQDRYTETHKQFLKKELADVKRKGYVYTLEYLTGDGDKKVEVYMDKKPHSTIKKIDDLSKDEMAQVLSTAQSQATKLTKKKVFNQK